MIIGVDIGGTKTLIAVFAENGKLLEEFRFATNPNYEQFLQEITAQARKLGTSKAKIACVAVPGLLDRKKGMVISLGNLPWEDLNIRHDLSIALGVEKVLIENDSKLAGLAEAKYLHSQYSRVVYITVSTGINSALIINGKLSHDVIDSEIGKMPLLHTKSMMAWEDFASGRAFFEKYGKKAVDVDDEKIWEEFAGYINQGLGVVCAAYQPEVIIFGGGLGQRLTRYRSYVKTYLETNLHPIVVQPKELLSTHYRGQSVIYGCYAYAKEKLA